MDRVKGLRLGAKGQRGKERQREKDIGKEQRG